MAHFEFLLFTTHTPLARRALAAGVDAFVIDWEFRGKHRRQFGADTQINRDTPDDLSRMRALPGAHLVVRINSFGPTTSDEIATALDRGADELLLPMVRSPEQVERTLALLRGRAPLGILIETTAALACAAELGRLPLRRIYVGLNDLAIDRQTPGIFAPLVDGTLERLRPLIHPPFGFGGLTLPECGHPVPCRLLMAELARLGATHSFLRRSFLADTAAGGGGGGGGGADLPAQVARMRAALAAAASRAPTQIAADRAELCHILPHTPAIGVTASARAMPRHAAPPVPAR